MTEFKGSCLCGQVSYELKGERMAFYHCHCQRCQKMSGTGHASNLRVKGGDLKWLKGDALISSYKVPEAERFRNDFCSNCGSPLPRHFESHGFTLVPAGTLDMDLDAGADARIFCGSKANWSCQDELPSFDQYPV